METTPIAAPVPSRTLDRVLTALAVLGMAFMSYLIYVHFKTSASSFCNFGAKFSCDLVNKSTYAEIIGVPVSAFGLLYFAFVGFVALRKSISHRYHLILLATAGSLAFSLFLTYVEIFVLDSVCVFCEASKLTMIAVLAVAWQGSVSAGKKVLVSRVATAFLVGAAATVAWRILAAW